MKKPTEVIVRGIKCDAPGCGYKDMEADVTDLDAWLNKPCPKCGASLVTQEDLDSVKVMRYMSDVVNGVFGEVPDEAEMETYSVQFDGSGIPDFVKQK